jgi:hypothetical protein
MQQKAIELNEFFLLYKEVEVELANLKPNKEYHQNKTSDELYYKFKILCMFYL